MPSVTDFRAALTRHGGVGRQFRWRVNFSFPAGIATNDEVRDASLMAISTTTPKSTLGEVMVPFGGRENPLPGDRKFEPMNFQVLQTEDDFAHTLFEAWSEAINGSDSNTSSGALEDLYCDVEIQLLNQQDEVVKTYVLEDAWPLEVGELTLDQSAQDSFGQFPLTLRYFKSRNSSAR